MPLNIRHRQFRKNENKSISREVKRPVMSLKQLLEWKASDVTKGN